MTAGPLSPAAIPLSPMKRSLIPALLILMAIIARAEWTPPEKPDPTVILREAIEDAEAGRYEDAVAKHVWFHKSALKHQPSLYGVRLSFALTAWQQLGGVYPPALEKLKAIRDEYGESLRMSALNREAFHAFESINEQLDERERTTELFVWFDENKPWIARGLSDLAQPSLIASKKYELAGKYLKPKENYQELVMRYKETKALAAKGDPGGKLAQHAEKSFSNGAATLVALLVKNGRKADAEEVAKKAAAELPAAELREELKKALAGNVPEPWP